jgi:hypothetical protein
MRDQTAGGICLVDGHRHPGTSAICYGHLYTAETQLKALPRLVAELTAHLVPGAAPAGTRSTPTRIGSPTPARLDVLSLVGPGTTDVRRDRRSLVPHVRRWSTVETVDVAVPGMAETRRRQIRVWHRELLTDPTDPGRVCRCGQNHAMDPDGHTPRRPLLTPVDDQIGAVPPAEWLDVWVCRWRRALGHPVPARTKTRGLARLIGRPAPVALPARPDVTAVAEDPIARLDAAAAREMLLLASRLPTATPAVAAYLAVRKEYEAARRRARDAIAEAALGRYDGHADAGRTVRVPVDTLSAEWELRYGCAATAARVTVDAGYLAAWLNDAAETSAADVAGFCTELAALTAELEYVLGETGDKQWLGRCPAELRGPDGEPTGRICGAGLWQDPYRSRIECPTCHTVWPEKRWLSLRAAIRATWPIDRRRLYTDGDRAAAELRTDRIPRCRGCEKTMAVRWQPCDVPGMRGPMWKPAVLYCPAECVASITTTAA